MADKLIGRLFARAKRAQEKCYVASGQDVSRLMQMFSATIEALRTAQESERDGFEVVDEKVGWPKLLKARRAIETLADLAEEKPLARAAERYLALRRFAPLLIEALNFKAVRDNDLGRVVKQGLSGSVSPDCHSPRQISLWPRDIGFRRGGFSDS